jgi:DNA-binding GntR family transcriptional regulator
LPAQKGSNVAKAVPTKARLEDKRGLLAVVDNDVSAVDKVIEALKAGIRQGRYVPGQRLIEPDMMREFGVSRGSVREALRCLESDGLVQIEFYRGARIRKMSRHEFIEASEIRGLLEGFAASLAAQRMTATERKRLIDLEQSWSRGARGWTYAEYNEKFHKLIVESSHHKQLPTYIEQVHLLLFDLQFHRIERSAAAIQRSTREHERVVEAILKGNSKVAERAMRDHIESSGAAILAAPEEFFS